MQNNGVVPLSFLVLYFIITFVLSIFIVMLHRSEEDRHYIDLFPH